MSRVARRAAYRGSCAATGTARSLYRSWRPGRTAEGMRSRCSRYRRGDSSAVSGVDANSTCRAVRRVKPTRPTSMKPIAIVQHEADAGPGHFEAYLLQRGLPYRTVRVYAADPIPRSADAFSGICSLGGSMSANDDLPWIDDELALLRDADQRGVPIIGHCLGGQLLAKAFGAPVTRNPMKEIGWSTVEVDDDELAREWIGSEPAFDLFQWHGDTFALPAKARHFLKTPLCANQAFVIDHDEHAHLAMQFQVDRKSVV